MIDMSFREFYKGDCCKDHQNNGLYMIITNNFVLYIGISNNIYDRWFCNHGCRHMTIYGKLMGGNSPIGEAIVRCYPSSFSWRIRLYNEQECEYICSIINKDIPKYMKPIVIKEYEGWLISWLSPYYNTMHNNYYPDQMVVDNFLKLGQIIPNLTLKERENIGSGPIYDLLMHPEPIDTKNYNLNNMVEAL